MTLAKRIIPCLDVDAGRVVKGVRFQDLRDIGDPVELAARYEEQGADEVVFLDISASHEGRATTLDMVRRTAERLSIPLTVGGGVRTPEDMRATLNAGADKVAINTAALDDPGLIDQCSERFGAQCVVVAVDGKQNRVRGEVPRGLRPDDSGVDGKQNGGGTWNCFTHGGRTDTGRDAVAWCQEAAERGAGEILLTSMDADGVLAGYDIPFLTAVCSSIPIPVVASGGCGEASHMVDALAAGADAALAASIFHDGDATVAHVKAILADAGISVRPVEQKVSG